MAKKTIKITDFQRTGITDQLRSSSGFGMIGGFETIRAEKLKPTNSFLISSHNSQTIQEADLTAFFKSDGTMYALGVDGSSPAIHYWDDAAIPGTWKNLTTFTSTGVANSVLQVYKGYFYGAMRGTSLWRGEVDGNPAPAIWQTLTYDNFAEMIHHTSDDILYFLYDNYIGKWDDNTLTKEALELPSDIVLVSGTQTDTYLLVGGYTSTRGDSIVYWWDRDSGLSTITAKNIIDIGQVRLVMRTGGAPIAIVEAYNEIRLYSLSLSGAKLVNRISGNLIDVGKKWEYDDRAYFGFVIEKDETTYRGIAMVDEFGRITFEYLVDAATSNITAVARDDNQLWASEANNNSYDLRSGLTTSPRIMETRFYRADDLTNYLDFVGATIYTEPSEDDGTLRMKYRQKVTDDWLTIREWDTTADGIEYSVVKQGADNKPKALPEIQFRFEVEGSGAKTINGINITVNEINKVSYDT